MVTRFQTILEVQRGGYLLGMGQIIEIRCDNGICTVAGGERVAKR